MSEMPATVIEVDRVSKKFRLGQDVAYSRLSESLQNTLLGLRRRLRKSPAQPASNEFWALRDIEFSVEQGQALGIIGRNGAGKSTLLKILSRITRPTSGQIRTRGRIGSLLEVGTGFHPELTGRENIFLNGSILGMSRREIERKFDEIVAFAEIDAFLDTPVKRYSSGMYTRLAFSVAAHLETEILIVDEVLAVGDAQFQKKCLGKMRDVAQHGRTVLFVSHNMSAIANLCQKVTMLQQGQVAFEGPPQEAISMLHATYHQPSLDDTQTFRNLNYPLHAVDISFKTNGKRSTCFSMGDPLVLCIGYHAQKPIDSLHVGYILSNDEGTYVLAASSRYQNANHQWSPAVDGEIECELGMIPLLPGRYYISLWLGGPHTDSDIIRNAISFEILEKNLWSTSTPANHPGCPLWWPTEFRHLGDDSQT